MKDIYIIDIMSIGLNNFMVHDVVSAWTTIEGAREELVRLKDSINDSEVGLLRATINGDRCSIESSETGRWRLLSRYNISRRTLHYD